MKFALVSTVDTIKGFPGFCVWIFEDEIAAYRFARKIILDNDASAVDNSQTEKEFVEEWQSGLDITEFFHLFPIRQA